MMHQARTLEQLAFTFPWVDRELQGQWVDDLFKALSIQGAPMGVWALQRKMGQAGLLLNELSRSLVEAREEVNHHETANFD